MSPVSDNQWLGLHNNYLVDVGTNHRLHRDVVDDFTAMQQAAAQDGLDLQLVSSYRDFARQTAIFNRKWRGETAILDKNSHPLRPDTLSDEEKLHAILMWSALPGGSRHHWGTDFDVYDKTSVEKLNGRFDLVESEYERGGPCYLLACWLEQHMARFGFFRPFSESTGGVAREPWHLSHSAVSKRFEKARNIQALENALSESEIEGKATILAMLPSLYNRYVLNKGNRSAV